jgi:hypothetical protein
MNHKRKEFDVRVTVRRIVLTDPAEIALADDRWYRSLRMSFRLLERLEAQEAQAARIESKMEAVK